MNSINLISCYFEIVEYLVELGANIHVRDEDALRIAASYGHLGIVKCLMSKGLTSIPIMIWL